jgi:hypothetical protein
MVEVEKYPCNDSNEARARERHWYEILNANMNSCVPGRSNKDSVKAYKDANKEKIKQYKKAWNDANYEQNKEKLKKNSKEYYNDKKDAINARRRELKKALEINK